MKHIKLISNSCAVALLSFTSGCAVLQNGAVDKAQSDFAEGNYESALNYLSKGEGYANAKPAVAAQIGFLKGLCRDGLNQPEKARDSFRKMAEQYPETDCGFMSKQLLNCEPIDFGAPLEPSATVRGLNRVFGIPPETQTYPIAAAAISGDGNLLIGEQIVAPHFILSGAPTILNLFRWTKTDGNKVIGAIQAVPAMEGVQYADIVGQTLRISNDGSVMAGNLADTNGKPAQEHAFRWTRAGGLQDLGATSKYPWTDVAALSANGSAMVGEYMIGARPNLQVGHFLWTQAGGFEDLGNLGSPHDCTLMWIGWISDDATVLTGTFRLRRVPGFHVFRWSCDGGFQDLGTFGGLSARTLRASADGSAVVAVADMDDKSEHVIRWNKAGGWHDLGILAERPVGAQYASDDGLVVVGSASVPKSNLPNSVPFRWTPATGLQYICELGSAWDVRVVGASRDGSRIVLNAYFQTAYNQGVMIPVDSMFIPLNHVTETRIFYKTFLRDFNRGSR